MKHLAFAGIALALAVATSPPRIEPETPAVACSTPSDCINAPAIPAAVPSPALADAFDRSTVAASRLAERIGIAPPEVASPLEEKVTPGASALVPSWSLNERAASEARLDYLNVSRTQRGSTSSGGPTTRLPDLDLPAHPAA